MNEKMKILKVTFTEEYMIPMYDDKRTKINGWTIQQVIDDWFKNHSLESYHATRDGHTVGNSRKLIKVEEDII